MTIQTGSAGRPARASLKNLRRRQPRRDRGHAALIPTAVPYDDGKPAQQAVRLARTIEELRAKCGNLGEAAVIEARWSAITAGLMREPGLPFTYGSDAAFEAVRLVQEECRHFAGLILPDVKVRPPIIRTISPESREWARHVAADAVTVWEAGGKPGLTEDRITWTHKFVIACQRPREEQAA